MTDTELKDAASGIGAELARAREEAGLALADVAQQLKFAPRQLEALEQGRFGLLPRGTFARGMVRNYARLLRLDADALVARMGRVDALDSNHLAARYKQPVPFSDNARRSTFVYLGVSLGVLVAVAGLGYQWYHEQQSLSPLARKATTKVVSTPAEAPVAAPVPVSHPAAPHAVPIPAQPALAKLEEKTAPREQLAPVKADRSTMEKTAAVLATPIAPGVHRIVLRCEDEAWLEVKDAGGRQILSSLNPAGCERVVQGRGPFMLVIGNASRVHVLHNDRSVDLQPHTKQDIARFTIP